MQRNFETPMINIAIFDHSDAIITVSDGRLAKDVVSDRLREMAKAKAQETVDIFVFNEGTYK
ncbi:MAG: hypothetical protein J1G06_01450 [Oscillospiraceae bacterium]|nr:hypothetical protein [Oscillospiraceae bacterium]